jgi:hypothetical protein
MEKRIEERIAGEKKKRQFRNLVVLSAAVGLVAVLMRRRK